MLSLTRTLGLEDHVQFLGWRDDILDVIAFSDVFVLPSFSEGVPRSIVEAMALGKPVIATEVGGVPELLNNGDYGVLVPAGDGKALGDAMARIAADGRLRQKFGEKGKIAARSNYTFDRHFAELIKILDSTI